MRLHFTPFWERTRQGRNNMTKLTKAEFEALPESLKSKFTASGDDYVLEEVDVEGLKKSKADILKEKKDLQDQLDGLQKFKAEHEQAASTAEEEKMKEAGKFKELEERYKAKITETEAERDAKIGEVKGKFFESSLKNLLSEKGVRPDMARYALIDAANEFELGDDYTLKLKGGIGDAKEIDGFVAKLRETTPDFFKSQTPSGGGASGSGNNGGSANTITRAQYDADFDKYSPQVGKGELTVVD